MIEQLFGFNPLIGNDILLTNPYGALYKIHGCINNPSKIVITNEDYESTKTQNELIVAQLISLFIHRPVIFLGYGLQDENVNGILKTIYTYVGNDDNKIESLKNNFLIVEYKQNSKNTIVTDYNFNAGDTFISTKVLKTDNYSALYEAIEKANYPISAMDVKKVQTIIHDIIKSKKDEGSIREVVVLENEKELLNKDKVLVLKFEAEAVADAIKETIYKEKYAHMNVDNFIEGYFELISRRDIDKIKIIDDLIIQSSQYFPIWGFSNLYQLKNANKIKKSQISILQKFIQKKKKRLNL